jgi:hypothetical protein
VLSTQDQSLLQDIVRRHLRSLAQYISDSFPWPNGDSTVPEAVFQSLAGEERDALAPLIGLLTRSGAPLPYLGSYPMAFTSMNFVSLVHMVPILQEHDRQAAALLQRDIARLRDPEARELAGGLLETVQRHVQRLDSLRAALAQPITAAGSRDFLSD